MGKITTLLSASQYDGGCDRHEQLDSSSKEWDLSAVPLIEDGLKGLGSACSSIDRGWNTKRRNYPSGGGSYPPKWNSSVWFNKRARVEEEDAMDISGTAEAKQMMDPWASRVLPCKKDHPHSNCGVSCLLVWVWELRSHRFEVGIIVEIPQQRVKPN